MLCFVVVMQSFIMNSHDVFIHIHQGCFAGTGAIVRLPQCQWSKPDGYGKISPCITTTKHSKAKTVCIFLGIYCTPLRTHISCKQGSLDLRIDLAISKVNHKRLLDNKVFDMIFRSGSGRTIRSYYTESSKSFSQFTQLVVCCATEMPHQRAVVEITRYDAVMNHRFRLHIDMSGNFKKRT